MVAAIIVTYNPEIDKLKENIIAVIKQVEFLIIVDNDSDNINEISKMCKEFEVYLVKNPENLGLAGALNKGFEIIKDKKVFDWVLTLDQDSACPIRYVDELMSYARDNVGIICANYFDRNLSLSNNQIVQSSFIEVKRAITSGSLVNINAYNAVNGYDENLFVDYVDFDFSVKIRQVGYKIIKVMTVNFKHELGSSTMKKFLFWKFRFTKHSSYREYLIAKNIIIFVKRYYRVENVTRDILSLIKHYILSLIYDEQRKEKLISLFNGTIQGIRYKDRNDCRK